MYVLKKWYELLYTCVQVLLTPFYLAGLHEQEHNSNFHNHVTHITKSEGIHHFSCVNSLIAINSLWDVKRKISKFISGNFYYHILDWFPALWLVDYSCCNYSYRVDNDRRAKYVHFVNKKVCDKIVTWWHIFGIRVYIEIRQIYRTRLRLIR